MMQTLHGDGDECACDACAKNVTHEQRHDPNYVAHVRNIMTCDCGSPCPLCPKLVDEDGNCTHGLCSDCPDTVEENCNPLELENAELREAVERVKAMALQLNKRDVLRTSISVAWQITEALGKYAEDKSDD